MRHFNYILITIIIIMALSMCDVPEAEPNITVLETAIDIGEIDAPQKLSAFNMFKAPISDMMPNDGVELYTLNSALFSDYAYKKRFIYLPEGTSMTYKDPEVFDFPEGSLIFKFFYYPHDFSQPEGERTIIETRVLLKQKDKWTALPYVWLDDQSDAVLSITGENIPVSWLDESGFHNELIYETPNINDCKSCHEYNKTLVPIGPAVRHLNKWVLKDNQRVNQLEHFKSLGWLVKMPELEECPSLADWQDPKSGTINERARAYLDINCGNCHHPAGPAKTSALHLHAYVDNMAALGVGKTPIAAGKGSGGRKYDIEPGDPSASILVYRMASNEPGIMMPEIGRKLVHDEGVELISSWIKSMD